MQTDTIYRGAALASRLVAFVAGAICVACAGAILFEDVVMRGASIELNHYLTAGILSIALLAGHLRGDAWRERRYTAALGFMTLFVAATALVVYLSTGKQAQHTFQSQAEADFAADERARIKPLLDRAQRMHSEALDKVDSDCVKGRKSKGHCDGLRTTLAVYEAAVKGHNADLAKLGVPKPVAPDAESFANIAAVFGFDKAKVKAGAVLVVPFIKTVLFELGGIWCLGFAFRPAVRVSGKSESGRPGNDKPRKTGKPGRRGRKSDPAISSFAAAYAAKHGRPPSGSEIRQQFPDLGRSTAYDYAQRARA